MFLSDILNKLTLSKVETKKYDYGLYGETIVGLTGDLDYSEINKMLEWFWSQQKFTTTAIKGKGKGGEFIILNLHGARILDFGYTGVRAMVSIVCDAYSFTSSKIGHEFEDFYDIEVGKGL